MRCPICSTEGRWKNVDQYRLKPAGMHMCESCGFVSYPEIVKNDSKLKDYYRTDYRTPPTSGNVFTGQRKLHYHAEFLAELFDKWKKENKKPVVCEIGAAFGMFLNWMRGIFPEGKYHGTELTLSFRRNAFHEFNLRLDEEFDDSRKYDLIASYKVAEHQPNIDIELRRYVEALKDTGLIYISVPIWFQCMSNFGASGFSLEYYYHTNHINVWSEANFEALLKKVGLEVIKKNDVYYDTTYLCKRNDELMKEAPKYDSPMAIIEHMDRIKKASDALLEKNYAEAIKQWCNFPEAHLARYESNRAQIHKKGWDWIKENVIETMIMDCPNRSEAYLFAADLSMRYDKFELALEYLQKTLELRPNNPKSLYDISNCFRSIAVRVEDPKQKAHYFEESRRAMRQLRQTSMQHRDDSINWIFHDNANIPMPWEN